MDPLNHRPIGLLPIISKVIESIVTVNMNPFLSQTASSQITNSDSHLVTLPRTCCFNSPNNGWRPSISEMRSGLYLWTYLKLLMQSGILPCSPNCLPLESKASSTLC